MTIPLQNCIESASLCSLKVNHAWKIKEKHILNIAKSSAGSYHGWKQNSPEAKKTNKKIHFENKI